jgi:hypothetical protein
MKKKLLYITNQQEYSVHGFIGPVFEKYLQEYMDVKIIYFTQYKSYFQKKGVKYILPEADKKDVLDALSNEGIDPSYFDYIIVRNLENVLKDILLNKDKYDYKVGFRVSYPKRLSQYEGDKDATKNVILNKIDIGLKTYFTNKLIDKCDIFLPTSKTMKDEFYSHIKISSIALPPGLDPDNIFSKHKTKNANITFIYEGTLDKLRSFRTVLDGFAKLQNKNWRLLISTLNPDCGYRLMDDYPTISDNITIEKAKNKEELYAHTRECDVGISLLPHISLYNISTPVKIIDYYANSLPVLMTDNSHNDRIFTDGVDALFCDFDTDSIHDKLKSIMDMKNDKLDEIGVKGQQRLLDVRNYKKISKQLFDALESL